MTGTQALAERLRRIDYMNWTAAEVAEKLIADGSAYLTPAEAARVAAIEEAARVILERGDRASKTPTWTAADRRRYMAEFATLRAALEVSR